MMGMTGQQLGGLPPPSHQQQQQQQAAAVAQQQAAAVAQHQAAVSSASVSSSFLAQAHAQLAALKSQVKSTCTELLYRYLMYQGGKQCCGFICFWASRIRIY